MAEDEMFDSESRSNGDLAGVFELSSNIGYFYLYATEAEKPKRIVGAIRVITGSADFNQSDIEIRRDVNEVKVALFIKGTIWAVFDTTSGTHYGGDYRHGCRSNVPPAIIEDFE